MLFQELGKLKRSSIMTSIVLMAMGIVMVICPDRYTGAVVSALGCVMLLCAIVMILDFIASRKVLIHYVYLTIALIMGILGGSVLIFIDHIVGIVGTLFGCMLIADGVVGVFMTLMYVRRSQRKGWWILIVLDALLLLFGLVILVNPWWDSPAALFDVIGGVLLFSSVVSMVRLILVWPIKGV